MNINKAHWVTEGNNVRLSMPIAKIDVERRTVSGFATLDNVDKQGDIVSTQASLDAFSKFRGNLREMHQPSAVGRIVSFKEDRYFDPTSKKFYKGVYVSAYVSKGAQDAWEKVMDGTYSGFSIGGNITKYDDDIDESMDKSVRVIKEYDLHELSLVDNPANQFANIVSIEKVAGDTVAKGIAAETQITNVFWDSENDIVMLSESDSALSPTSGKTMQNIGFVETTDSDNSEAIKFLVDSAKGISSSKIDKEVSPMTENTEAATEEVAVEKSEEVAPEAEAETPDESVEKGYKDKEKMEDGDMEEEDDEEEDEEEMKSKSKSSTKKSDDEATAEVSKSDETVTVVNDLKDSLSSAFSDLSSVVKTLSDEVAELKKSLGEANSELQSVKSELTETKTTFDEFGKRVDAVEEDTAFRKSGDLGEIVQEPARVQKSLWGGRFLTNTDLFN